MKVQFFKKGEVLGSMMGYAKAVSEDGWAVVCDHDEEYANGGRGPSQFVTGLWATESEAIAAMERAVVAVGEKKPDG